MSFVKLNLKGLHLESGVVRISSLNDPVVPGVWGQYDTENRPSRFESDNAK